MRRILAAAIGLALAAGLVAAPTLAHPKIACSVSPSSAPAGSIFTVSATGANAAETDVSWYSENLSTFIYYDVEVPNSGKFSSSQQINQVGLGWAVVDTYALSYYTTAVCFFSVT